jgi:hypothetical protein
MVPDCNGGRIAAPLWLRRIPFWAALCVHGTPNLSLNVEVGTNLIKHVDLRNGDSASFYQVYYALNAIHVERNQKKVVWAVCGGGGINLNNGERVIVSTKLPRAKAELLSTHVNQLIEINNGLDQKWQLFHSLTKPEDKTIIKKDIDQLELSLTDSAGLLRDALIHENRGVLRQPNIPPRPSPGIPKRRIRKL